MSNAALAFMAGLASGGLKGYQIRREMDKDDEASALRKEQAERQRTEWQREDKLRNDLATAAQPRMAQSAEVYQPTADDEYGPAGALPANPTAGTFKTHDEFNSTGARMGVYPSMEAAQQAAGAAGTQNDRLATAYMANGAPEKALSIQASGRQAKAADLQIAQAEETAKQRKFMQLIGTAWAKGGIDGLADAATKGYDDGHTYTAVQKAGKGFSLMKTSAHGTSEELPFDDLDDFLKKTYAAVDPSKVVEWRDRDKQQTQAQENANRTFDLQKQQFALAGQREARMGAAADRAANAAERQAKAAEEAARPKQITPDSTFDAKTAADIAQATVVEEAKRASENGAPMTPQQMAQRNNDIVTTLRQDHTNRFVSDTVQRSLAQAKAADDPAVYSVEYSKAARLMTPEQLKGLGFLPPTPAGPPAPAAGRAQPTAPATENPAMGAPAKGSTRVGAKAQEAKQVAQQVEQQLAAATQELAQATATGDPKIYGPLATKVTHLQQALALAKQQG